MNIFKRIGGYIMSFFRKNAEAEFGVDIISSVDMEKAQNLWDSIIKNNPPWLSENVKSINFAKFLCQFTAKKACLDLRVNVEGSEKADYINKCISEMVDKAFRDKVEDACGIGGIILKPNGSSNPADAIDYIMPWNYAITEKNGNGDIRGIIFITSITKGDDYYTRLEYHHFINAEYEDGTVAQTIEIENRAYKSKGKNSLGDRIELTAVPEWADISEKTYITGADKLLFAYLKMPTNNTIDYNSPEGVAIFANCIEELKDLDIAWSMKANEVEDSEHITFIDETALTRRDSKGNKLRMELPRFVKGLKRGVDAGSTIDEHVATLLTGDRIADINSILSMISTKAGFSQGQFVLDRKTGNTTATQIESDDRETIETIMDVRKAIKSAIKDLIYALDKYTDLLGVVPVGYVNALDDDVPDEDIFYFKDLLITFEQDRNRAYQLMLQGIYSKVKYLTEYEGFSREEAEAMMEEAKAEQQQKKDLFSEE